MDAVISEFGDRLNRMWKVGAKHAVYSKEGNGYDILREFPGAFFDPHGYVVFKTESAFRGCRHLQISDHVDVPDKISNIPTYQTRDMASGSLANWWWIDSSNRRPSLIPLRNQIGWHRMRQEKALGR